MSGLELIEKYGLITESANIDDEEVDRKAEAFQEELERPPVIFDYLVNIDNLINNQPKDNESPGNPHIPITSTEYIELLLMVSGEFDFEDIFLNPENFPDAFTRGGANNASTPELYRRVLESSVHLAFSAFASLLLFHFRHNNWDQFKQLFDKHSDRFQQDEYQHIINLFESYIVLNSYMDPSQPDLIRGIELSYQAYENGCRHYLIITNFADSVATAYEETSNINLENTDLEFDKEQLIKEAQQAVDDAKQLERTYVQAYIVSLRLNILAGKYDDARKDLMNAARFDQSQDFDYLPENRRQQFRRSIEIGEQYDGLNKNIKNAKEELGKLQVKFEDAVDRYRKNTLRFIGFFAALITFAITSVQLLRSPNLGVQEQGQVIGMLAGGMLTAFGGFGFILPVYDSESRNELLIRSTGVVLLGVAIFTVSYCI